MQRNYSIAKQRKQMDSVNRLQTVKLIGAAIMLKDFIFTRRNRRDIGDNHCVKSVLMRSYFWSVFSCILTEYGDLQSKSPYPVRMQENADQK